ncbi:MAG: sensory transduction histidine kinase [Bacteroidota bacterium]|nr:sensory transduction histidine kinase [Bacteroidota bacterium]
MTQQELKVLLIEDNPGDAFLMKFYLGESTSPVFHVSHSEDVKGGLELLSKEKFDIILSDMNLPDSFGVDTIKSILTKYPGNLVIVLTGLTDEEVGLETVRYGAQDFLVKGKFDGKVLISSVMFSFERFKLNKQIDSVSKQLDEENSRLDMMQRLLNVGYIEFDPATNKVFRSDYMRKLVGMSADEASSDNLEEGLQFLLNSDGVKDKIKDAIEKNTTGEYLFKRKGDDNQYKLLFEGKNGKLSGVIQKIS